MAISYMVGTRYVFVYGCYKLRLYKDLATRYASLTWVGYFSQMGGLFGLCLGFRLVKYLKFQLNQCFSLLSGVELIYWFVIVLSRKILALR